MKIACICNMNNNMFVLTRYLRDLGFDTDLIILNSEPEHFHPSFDSFNNDYESYTKKVSWGSLRSFYTVGNSVIRRDVKGYDFIIACGPSLAFLNKVGIEIDVISSYGSDLSEMPFMVNKNPLTRDYWLTYFFKNSVKQAFRKAKCVCRTPIQQIYRDLLKQIDPNGRILDLGLPFMHLPSYEEADKETFKANSPLYSAIKKIKQQSDILVFYHSRQLWKTAFEVSANKGTDKLYKAMALFKKNNPSVKINLVTFEYGDDVDASKELINELGLTQHVHWFGLSKRKDIVCSMELADFACGQFHTGCSGGGAAIEVMSSKTPMLHYRNDAEFKAVFDFPIVNVKEPDQIAAVWEDYPNNKQMYLDNAEECYNRLEKRNQGFTSLYVDFIKIKQAGKSVKEYSDKLIDEQLKNL